MQRNCSYSRLLEKLETAREALGGRVYDVLGRLFEGNALRDLLMEAIRYGDQPEVKARLFQTLDDAVDQQRLWDLLAERTLVHDALNVTQVAEIREQMERAEARRLQPHFIQAFFLEAFQHLGGRFHRREPGRWEISYVPGPIRDRDRLIGIGEPVLPRYERIGFEKDKIHQTPVAAFVCPGHPLMNATLDLILERHRELLKRGAVLVDDLDEGETLRVLFYLEHALQDGRPGRHQPQQIISQRLQFVEYRGDGTLIDAGPAPYLDYRPILEEERAAVAEPLEASWLSEDLENRVIGYAIQTVVQQHLEEVRARKLPQIDRVQAEVEARLKREINYWDHRAEDLKAQERAGKKTRLSSVNAAARADELADRLQRRLAELHKERQISALPPQIRGGALVVPGGLLRRLTMPKPDDTTTPSTAAGRAEAERLAMAAVMNAERLLGFEPRDVSAERIGYDIESRDPDSGRLRFIEVKGRIEGADTVTVTRNEILTALNKPEAFILAIVRIVDGAAGEPLYIREPFTREPDFGATSVNYDLAELLVRATSPTRQ